VLRATFSARLAVVLDAFAKEVGTFDAFAAQKATLLKMLDEFEQPPFTLQRLAELLLEPRRQYGSTPKYMNGVLKLLSVSSYLEDPTAAGPDDPMDE